MIGANLPILNEAATNLAPAPVAVAGEVWLLYRSDSNVALAQVDSVAARVGIPVVGMGGVQTGAHARDLLRAGATLVAVGTESFRDPAAGTRIARELREKAADSAKPFA